MPARIVWCVSKGLLRVATMIREEILNAKLITITFIVNSFVNVSDLPDCTSH